MDAHVHGANSVSASNVRHVADHRAKLLLPHPLRYIIHQPPCHLTLYIAASHRNVPHNRGAWSSGRPCSIRRRPVPSAPLWQFIARHFMLCTAHSDQIEKSVMGAACSTNGGEERCIPGCGGETRRKETTWKTQAQA
jgi:hypothetical protein